MVIKLTSVSPSITRKVGSILSKILKSGDILLLDGELGAGKTTFISGIAAGLGINENLSSPSFTIINLYKINPQKKFIHADFYRLDNVGEILNTGIEDYLQNNRNIACIEWGDKLKGFLGSNYLEVKFEYFYPSGPASAAGYITGNGEEYDFSSDLEKRIVSFSSTETGGYWEKKLKILKRLLERQKCIFLG
jgi:tRNA threonylcarbamoyladenosine biosynthesis protein TsaE